MWGGEESGGDINSGVGCSATTTGLCEIAFALRLNLVGLDMIESSHSNELWDGTLVSRSASGEGEFRSGDEESGDG